MWSQILASVVTDFFSFKNQRNLTSRGGPAWSDVAPLSRPWDPVCTSRKCHVRGSHDGWMTNVPHSMLWQSGRNLGSCCTKASRRAFVQSLPFLLYFPSNHKSYNELASFLPGCGSEVRSLEQRHWLPGEAVWNGSGPRRPPSPSKLLAVGVQKNLPPTGTCL